MGKDPKRDWYYPLGAVDYAHEIHDQFPEEAEMLGVITILWNRQELALRRIYLQLIASKRPAYAEAIWDKQPTHQARRDLLALALHTVRLTKRQKDILGLVIEKTKTVADRRNELIHAEYVVAGHTGRLNAKVKAPRSTKPPKHQPVSATELRGVVEDIVSLVQLTEGAWAEFRTRAMKELSAALWKDLKDVEQFLGNPLSDSDLLSRLRTPHAK